MKNITLIAGARPNFMKIAPIIHEINRVNLDEDLIEIRLIHTGQHFDHNMSDTFFRELGIPEPDINLNIGGGSQAEQTAGIMVAFENELLHHPADLVLVVGDVTSSMACTIVAKKLHTKVAHVEAGIRSFDLKMPEEINRMVTDSITDYYFTTSKTANENLKKEGVAEESIFFVGNVMIDTLKTNIKRLKKPTLFDKLGLVEKRYFVITLHRPTNVDEGKKLVDLLDEIINNVRSLPIIFPVHPRTAKIIEGLEIAGPNLYLVEPLGYLEFNYLVKNSMAVITDSGGITEETTMMRIPCMTLRDNTERPETCDIGTNELIGTNPAAIAPALKKLFDGNWKKGSTPELWDGKAAGRIVKHLLNKFI